MWIRPTLLGKPQEKKPYLYLNGGVEMDIMTFHCMLNGEPFLGSYP